jgi:Ankyrin repeat
MLDLGFPLEARRGHDWATARHAAAGSGGVDVVRLLLDRGADIDAPDPTWRTSALIWASVGSGLRLGHAPDPTGWPQRSAHPRGAPHWDASVAGKPPSSEVAELLAAYAVGPPADPDTPGNGEA